MPAAAAMHVTYYDTAMTLIEIGSLRLLTDPLFDPAGTVFEHGPVRLEKRSPRAIDPAALGRIDAVLLSHEQHGDNLDHGGRAFLAQVPRVLTTHDSASRLGANARGLAEWEEMVLTGPDGDMLTVTAAPAQHGPDGTQAATGPVTGFVLTGGPHDLPVYISGDTVPFAGTDAVAARFAPVGLALLHLGHVALDPLPGMHFSLNAAEAIELARALQARTVVPLHFDGWAHFAEPVEAARAAFAASPIAGRVHWLAPGERGTFAP